MSGWGYADVTSLNRERLQRDGAHAEFDAKTWRRRGQPRMDAKAKEPSPLPPPASEMGNIFLWQVTQGGARRLAYPGLFSSTPMGSSLCRASHGQLLEGWQG